MLSGEANCGGVEVASLAGGKAAGWAAIKGFGSPGGGKVAGLSNAIGVL